MRKSNPLKNRTKRLDSTPRTVYNQIMKKHGSMDKNKILNDIIDSVIDSYPDEMKNGIIRTEFSELYLCDVNPDKLIKLKRIANNIGVSDSALLKIKIYESILIT